MSPMICKRCNRTISLPNKHDKRNNDAIVINIERDKDFGVYHFDVNIPGKEPYMSGSVPSISGVLDTLENEFYEIGWQDINDSR